MSSSTKAYFRVLKLLVTRAIHSEPRAQAALPSRLKKTLRGWRLRLMSNVKELVLGGGRKSPLPTSFFVSIRTTTP